MRVRAIAAVLATASTAFGSPAGAQAPDAGAPPPPGPDWTRKATGGDSGRYFPREAERQGVREAKATIRCTVTVQGKLTDCQVTSETPSGMGIGEAALKMAPLFVMHP